ncbi:hypothetical protein FOQG_06578 [Fusarium oxysporum f. sp. raphani 54005]|uniref:Uncharacterized protein n=4 Tax=Fusarium oxysporum TaxID=5507 RepID=W9IEL0_FUSOX|nr:hypothetical protein FOYG_08235 [Fusarium oxysporum NRRL 32931]EXA45116.1 hypothetical protein FOVG_06290 [Fusarium oxysporum f. sp. pisi HDV247]EXK91068.1 hypothetical protein FOQG_06578 [Fusarium oxysporum f. sp. raphani 54005]EXL84758.1 hypothetical protein FOPG_03231 [Fusarium oxysporum f. sp. conglutinans race 2 54008]
MLSAWNRQLVQPCFSSKLTSCPGQTIGLRIYLLDCATFVARISRSIAQSSGDVRGVSIIRVIVHRAAKYLNYMSQLLLATKVAGNLPSTQSLASSGVKPWLKTVGDDLSSELSRSPGRR